MAKKRKKKNYVSGLRLCFVTALTPVFLDHPQEDQAQEEEGQDGHPQVLQGRIGRQDPATPTRV
jgi:hypothetical protein